MKESVIQRRIVEYLVEHPDVSWAYITSTGTFRGRNHRYTIGFNGLSDIIGQLKDGRLLAIEVKKIGGELSSEQEAFIFLVNKHNGLGFVANSVNEVATKLDLFGSHR